MLEINWRCTCAANLRIVVFAVVCEVLLDAIEEEIISLLFRVVLVFVGFERLG